MQLLILGGTQFVGRHLVEQALANGHQLTLVHRGKTGADLFPECEHLLLDRSEGLGDLGERTWDAVIDVSGYVPRVVRLSCEALRGRVKRYVFVSTISVYDCNGQTTLDEDSPQLVPPAWEVEEINGETYGGLKVACEREVLSAWGDSATIVRPGIVIGPYDHTKRFELWVRAMQGEGPVDVPQRSDQPVQFIDGRDLGAFMLHVTENNTPGTYNAIGPVIPTTMGAMLSTIKTTLSSKAELISKPLAELEKAPLSLPEDGSHDALFCVSSTRGQAVGLKLRSLVDTVTAIA